jgi:hypothetical protein
MPARIIAIYTAVVAFLGLKPKPAIQDMEGHIMKAIDKSHRSWVKKGWVEEKTSTKA